MLRRAELREAMYQYLGGVPAATTTLYQSESYIAPEDRPEPYRPVAHRTHSEEGLWRVPNGADTVELCLAGETVVDDLAPWLAATAEQPLTLAA